MHSPKIMKIKSGVVSNIKIISENIKYFLNLPLKSGMDLKYLLPALSLRKTVYFWFEQK